MSRAHREILHLARLLERIAENLPSEKSTASSRATLSA
jgi:hypothetical protein